MTKNDEDFDETCFIYFKQTLQKRNISLPPKATLMCLKRNDSKTNGELSKDFHVTTSNDYIDIMNHLNEMSKGGDDSTGKTEQDLNGKPDLKGMTRLGFKQVSKDIKEINEKGRFHPLGNLLCLF